MADDWMPSGDNGGFDRPVPPPPDAPLPPPFQPPPGAAPPPYQVPSQPPPFQPGAFPPAPGPWGSGPMQGGPLPSKQRRTWPWLLGALGVLLVLSVVVVAAIAVGRAGDSDPVSDDVARDAPPDPDGGTDVMGAADEVDDVGPCQFLDADRIVLDVTNNSSRQSSYIIDVNFLDDSGARVGDEPFFVNHLRSGERAVEELFVLDAAGGTSCEIAEVERFLAESADDVNEVGCEVTGLDFADDIAAEFVATNGSSEVSDYYVTGALVRDGIRIGTSFASIDNVRPGESAPGDGFSFAPGPVDGVTCEVVDVTRTSSE